MVAIDAKPAQSRLHFPFKDPEQRWEWVHNTQRSAAAQLVMIPVSAVSRLLLRDPVFDNIEGGGKNNKKIIKSLEITGIEYIENVAARTAGAQIIRSWTHLYKQNKKFQRCINAGEILSALTVSAAQLEDAAIPLAEELKQGRFSPLHDFMFHSEDANQLISDFVTGELPVNPTNLSQLEQHMQALAELASQPVQMAETLRQQAPTPTDGDPALTRPSDYLRQTIQAEKLTDMRQLQLFFSLLPPLITHGALALSHVEYVPQEKRFLSVKESVQLAEAVEQIMLNKGYEYNRDSKGSALNRTLPTNAIVKRTADGYIPLTQKELLNLGNLIHSRTKEIAGTRIDRVLSYADEHYEAVEKQMLQSIYPSTKQSTISEKANAASSLENPLLATPWKDNENRAPGFAMKGRGLMNFLGAMWKNITTPEAKHEKKKLYIRKLPKQILNGLLINFEKDVILKTNGSWSNIVKAAKGQPFYDAFAGKERKYFWKAHWQKEAWAVLANPLAGSWGLVNVKELFSTGKQLTDDAIQRLNKHFGAAITTGLEADATIQQSLQQSQRALQQKSFNIPPLLKAQVERIQQKSPQDYTPEDYQQLQTYFATMAGNINKQHDSLMQPYRQHQGESLQDAIARAMSNPVEDLPSALMALSFVQTTLQKELKNLHSLEFVDPKKNLMPLKSFKNFARFMEGQLTSAGIAMAGETYKGSAVPTGPNMPKGTLVQYNPATKSYEPAKADTIIRLANVVSSKFRYEIGRANLVRLTDGTVEPSYFAAVEKKLFETPQQAAAQTPRMVPITSGATPWDATQKQKRSRGFLETLRTSLNYAMRPEAMHEARLLFNRTFFARLSGIPISLYQLARRGYTEVNASTTEDKKSKTLRKKWDVSFDDKRKESILKNIKKNYLTKGGILSQIYSTLAFPTTEFIGTIGREMARYKTADIIEDSASASSQLQKLAGLAPTIANDWDMHYLEHSGKSAALSQQAGEEMAKMIPRVAMKPAHLRTQSENHMLNNYMEQAGALVLASTSQLLNSPAQGAVKLQQNIFTKPASTMAEAHETINFIQATIDASRQHLGVIRYVDPKKVIIDAKGLAKLSATIETQSNAAEKSGELQTEQGYIRLANVIRDRFLETVSIQKLQAHLSRPTTERAIA